MKNIQLKQNKKRSVESLIDSSAIDQHSFNYEAYEARVAYTQTLRELSNRNIEQENQIQKLKIVLNEKEQEKQILLKKSQQMQKNLMAAENKFKDYQVAQQHTQKRLKYLQKKLTNFTQNRNCIPSYQEQYQLDISEREKERAQIYQELNSLVGEKVKEFSSELRSFSMTMELQKKIEAFLEQLIYLNPHSNTHKALIKYARGREIGKISRRNQEEPTGFNITDEDEWKKLQKSMDKLRKAQKVEKSSRSPSPSPLNRHPQQELSRNKLAQELSRTKSKKRIFEQ